MIISPNMLKTIDKSEQAFIEKYINKIPEIQLSKTFIQGKEIHALANYYLKGENISKLETCLKDSQKIFWEKLKNNQYFQMECVNSEYTISSKLGNYWIGGRIDALVKENDNIYILDYKTGQIPKNSEFDYQTMVYLYSVDKLIKKYNSLNFVYIGLKNSKEELIKFSDELNSKYEKKLLETCNKIKKCCDKINL